MNENDVSKLKKRRGLLKASLTRFKSFLDNYKQESDYNALRVRLKRVKPLLSDFENVHMSIELAENADDDESRQLYENNYYEAMAKVQEYIDAPRNIAVSTGTTTEETNMQAVLAQLSNLTSNDNSVKLPTITLPKFDGKYEDWLSFEDSFSALVHNNAKIQAVQKFNYLKSCLIGNASQIIQSLSSIAENYEIAWNLLKERYNNERIIIQNHVRALFELQPATKESSVSLSALIDTALKHIYSLQALEQPVEGWDALLLHLIGSKVDKRTQMEWEKSLDGSQLPTLEQYLKFLRNRYHVLEAIPKDANKAAIGKTKQVLLGTQSKVICHVCGKLHNIQNCEEFKAMSQSDKSEAIKRAGLCFNCFRANHKVLACKASNCKKCDRKHHTLLHPIKSSDGNQIKGEHVQQKEQSQVQDTTSKAANQILSSRVSDTSHILLSTAIIDIADIKGEFYSCRVVLDAGS
ncbi:hypothetical protein ALC60_05723 [Trachymyrmex zeteki]|nr:hypothetical protein ALC60_05723 [Trachymyrmex zeteki]